MDDLKIYLPKLYNNIVEMQAVVTAENVLWGNADTEMQNAMKDQFAHVATLRGLEMFELMLGISTKHEDTVELRRQRILSRLSTTPPFTLSFLEHHLRAIIGTGNYEVSMDYANMALTVRIRIPARQFFAEAEVLLEEVVPANILVDLSLKYNTHQDLSKFTHAQLAAYTHTQLREEVL